MEWVHFFGYNLDIFSLRIFSLFLLSSTFSSHHLTGHLWSFKAAIHNFFLGRWNFISYLENLQWIRLHKRMQTHRVHSMDYWKTNWPALVYVYSATVSKKVIWYIMILDKLETLTHHLDHHRHLHPMLSWLTQRVRVLRKDRSTKEWLQKVIFRVWQ